jgi:hypothetical protein
MLGKAANVFSEQAKPKKAFSGFQIRRFSGFQNFGLPSCAFRAKN